MEVSLNRILICFRTLEYLFVMIMGVLKSNNSLMILLRIPAEIVQ